MPTSTARTMKGPRRLARRRDRRSPSPQWQFLRGFLKYPKMVASIVPSSRVLIEKMLAPVDWERTPLGHLQVLPLDGQPLVAWSDREQGWREIVQALNHVVDETLQ